MKLKLTKSDLKFLFSNFEYLEQLIRLLRDLRILLAEDVSIELEDKDEHI